MKLEIIVIILTIFFTTSGCINNPKISFEGEYDFDLEEALVSSEKKGKPLLIYFSGFACVNCRYAEENILGNNEVIKLISNNYEFITLYFDDRELIENKEEKRMVWGGKIIKRNGSLNQDYQYKLTRAGSQPVFATVEDQEVSKKIFYDFRDMDAFLIFLDENKID